jgi:hypothetical protein
MSRSRQKGIAQEQREEGLRIAPAANQQSREGIAQEQERTKKIDTGMGISW